MRQRARRRVAAHRLLSNATMRFALLAVTIVALASPAAHAAPIAGGLDYTVARGGALEHFELGWRLEAGLFLQIGRWHATGSFAGLMHVRSDQPQRDGPDLASYGFGGRIAYHLPISDNGVVLVALGFERVWLNGETEVVRGCRQTGACMFGYYTGQPQYNAWAPQLRVGVGAFAPAPRTKLGSTFEIIVEPLGLNDVPPDGARGIALYAALTCTVGASTTD